MVDFVAENQPNPMFQMGPQAKSVLGISPAPTDLGKYGQNAPVLLAKKNAEVDQQIAAKEAERTAATKPLSEGAQQSRQALEKTLEAGPKTEAMPEKVKFTPTDVQQNMGVLMALAALSGAVSRQPLTASLNAMAGMIKGAREGDEARFQKSYKEYDQNLKTVIEKNRQYENEFNRIVKSRETSISEKTEQLRLLNLQFDRKVAQVAAQKQDYKGVVDLGMRAQRLTSDAENRRLQLQQMAEARRIQHEDRMTMFAQRQKMDNIRAQHLQNMDALAKIKTEGGGKLTESEQKSTTNWNEMRFANEKLDSLAQKGIRAVPISTQVFGRLYNPETGGMFASAQQEIRNSLSTSEEKQAFDAALAYTLAQAHAQGGARPSAYQVQMIWNTYIPMAGEDDDTIDYKTASRQNILESVKVMAGKGISKLPEGSRGEDKPPAQSGGWNDEKERRYQELKAKQDAAQ